MLEDTLRIAHEMWQGERGTQARVRGPPRPGGAAAELAAVAVTRPHPPIMIGGGGEQKTLRLVAQYADATNVFGGPVQIHHKYEVLRAHCEAIGRDRSTRSSARTLQSVRPRRRRRGAAAETPAQSSTASASWPTPAPSTSSSASAGVDDPAGSS